MQSKQQLKTVDHQDVKIIFEYGMYSTVALVASEDLNIYHTKLISLTTRFEQFFQDVLSQWSGEIEVFLPAKRLIETTFS